MKRKIQSRKKVYNIIYADPAWRFETWSEKGKGRSPEKHYKTMSLEEINRLHVAELAETDCVLFLWTTSPNLHNALQVIAAWGFTYKTDAFTWIKKNKNGTTFSGLGFWTRGNTEFSLLATKGNPQIINRNISGTIISKRKEHSRKPNEVRERIVQLMGNLPRIELFARERVSGWDAWGDEVDSHVFQKSIHISTKKISSDNTNMMERR